MRLDHLFQPLDVGPMRVANRIVMAPMERNYGNADGTVSERTIAHYAMRAHGGVGWIDVESTFVDPAGRGRTHQLGLHDDRCVDGFRTLADAVHAGGAKVGVELHHAGRNTSRAISGLEPVAPSAVPCVEAGGDMPRELTVPEIEAVLERYRRAAERAVAAGFDAVELHSAHGYLPLAFLSPLTNRRADGYGGGLEQRARFAVEAIAALRAAAGDRVAVGCRFSAEEGLAGGLTIEDAVRFARLLEAAGVDYLSVSAGVYASFARIIPPMDHPQGWLLPAARAIREAVDVPVVGASRIVDPAVADAAIARGDADLVAMGRALLTDPDLPRKARAGRLEEIVSCIGCNQGCESRISRQRDVTCLVNPSVGREAGGEAPPPARRWRVAVVGGGPAGMEAARVCGERGHAVTLYEREERLGGMVRWAAALPHRDGWRTFLEQAERRLRASGVDVRLGAPADAAALSDADAVVWAAGATFAGSWPSPPDGWPPEATPPELIATPPPAGAHVAVVGAGAVALGAAEWVAARGGRATVIAAEPEIRDPDGQAGLVERLRATGRVALLADRELAAGAAGEVVTVRSGAIGALFEEPLPDVAVVVRTEDRRPRTAPAQIGPATGGPLVLEVGDCRIPRTALEAVYEGAAAGHRI